MTYKLCIAEKPSAAHDIAMATGANTKRNYYYEGNGYLVTWAIGHLVGLAEPEAYGYESQKEMWGDGRDKAYKELPILPREYKLIILEKTKSQFYAIKKLMERPDVDMVIDCGDMGAEGHLLQWLIREKAGCNVSQASRSKPVMRFCATSLTDEAIRKAMADLRPISDFTDIIRGQYCKKKADWSLGMSVSRAMSLKHSTNLSIGRVQTPTLFFVVQRYLEAENFKETNYFGMKAALDKGFDVTWETDTDGYFNPAIKDSKNRVLKRKPVETAAAMIEDKGTGIVKKAETVNAKTERPQLYDITELQKDANKKYGYTAAVTLATAQSLYETHKLLTYPRTDSRYITPDLAPLMEGIVRDISSVEGYKKAAQAVLSVGLNLDNRVVDGSKVTDHHALICTDKIRDCDMNKLAPTATERKSGVTPDTLKNILSLVLGRILTALYIPYLFKKTTIEIEFAGKLIFTATDSLSINKGWKWIQEILPGGNDTGDEEKKDDMPSAMMHLTAGQTVKVNRCTATDKKTTPPKLHTEATLLAAMEKAGAVLGEDGAILKGKGIGTPATRAEIIRKLFTMEYVTPVKSGKTTYIKPAKKGISLIREVPKELRSPRITAQWEEAINNICEGGSTDAEFMAKFETFVRTMVSEIKSSEGNPDAFKREPDIAGVCPWCKGEVRKFVDYKTKETCYYCGSKCGWRLDANSKHFTETFLKRPLNEKEALKFIAQKYIDIEVISNSGKPYKRRFEFKAVKNDDGTRTFCNIISDFAPN